MSWLFNIFDLFYSPWIRIRIRIPNPVPDPKHWFKPPLSALRQREFVIFFFLVVPYSAILLSLSVLRYRASIWAFLYLRESAKKRERGSA